MLLLLHRCCLQRSGDKFRRTELWCRQHASGEKDLLDLHGSELRLVLYFQPPHSLAARPVSQRFLHRRRGARLWFKKDDGGAHHPMDSMQLRDFGCCPQRYGAIDAAHADYNRGHVSAQDILDIRSGTPLARLPDTNGIYPVSWMITGCMMLTALYLTFRKMETQEAA